MCSLHVVYQLSLKQGIHLCNGLEFEDYLAIYNKIGNVFTIKNLSMIEYGQMLFPLERYARLCQFNGESFLIDLLKETASKAIMHIITSPKDFVRQLFVKEHSVNSYPQMLDR